MKGEFPLQGSTSNSRRAVGHPRMISGTPTVLLVPAKHTRLPKTLVKFEILEKQARFRRKTLSGNYFLVSLHSMFCDIPLFVSHMFLHCSKHQLFHIVMSLQHAGISAGGITHIHQVLTGDLVNAGLQCRTSTNHLCFSIIIYFFYLQFS